MQTKSRADSRHETGFSSSSCAFSKCFLCCFNCCQFWNLTHSGYKTFTIWFCCKLTNVPLFTYLKFINYFNVTVIRFTYEIIKGTRLQVKHNWLYLYIPPLLSSCLILAYNRKHAVIHQKVLFLFTFRSVAETEYECRSQTIHFWLLRSITMNLCKLLHFQKVKNKNIILEPAQL